MLRDSGEFPRVNGAQPAECRAYAMVSPQDELALLSENHLLTTLVTTVWLAWNILRARERWESSALERVD